MRILDKSIHAITPDNMRELVYTRRLPETRTLDYKQELPSDKKKHDFLKDVGALANSAGGVLVYGVKEERDEDGHTTGIPEEIVGLADFIADQEIRRLDQIIMDGLQPRLRVEFKPIQVDGKWVLILGVPRSLLAPHIIWFEKSGKFYARGSTSNYQMDVHQIREAFLQSESWEKQADNFRRARLMDIHIGENQLLPNVEHGLFVHVVPLGVDRIQVNYKSHQDSLMALKPVTLNSGGGVWLDTGFNLDGFFVRYRGQEDSYLPFHTQYFRNGATELYTNTVFTPTGRNWTTALSGDALERFAVKWLNSYLMYALTLEISPPFGVFISLLGTKDMEIMGVCANGGDPFGRNLFGTLTKNEILLPGIVIDDYGSNLNNTLTSSLRPVFDVLWQASGHPESPHYKEDGTWGLVF